MAGEIVGYKPFAVHLAKWDIDTTIVRTEDGRTFFAVRSLCEGMGISMQSQLEMLRKEDIYAEALHTFRIPTDGGEQKAVCIRKRECAWWIGHITPRRCKPEVRDRLAEFQADLMAAADRLAFGDLSDVLDGAPRALQPLPHGVMYFHCQRCDAPHRLILRDGQVYIEIDDQREP